MSHHYNLKDKKLSVWSFTDSSKKGVTIRTYQKKYSLIWAYYRHTGGTAYTNSTNGVVIYDENADALFVIGKRAIVVDDLIIYDHKIYEVTRVDDFENYVDDIKIYAKLATVQNFSAYSGLVDD